MSGPDRLPVSRPEPAPGWRIVSYETGPDDDVDAVFAKAAESIEIEVFCNRGIPTVADLERKTLPEGDDLTPPGTYPFGAHGQAGRLRSPRSRGA